MPTPAPEPQSNLTEREESQLPALDLLARLGYHVLTREQALALRGGKATTPLLTDILRAQLPRLNTIVYKGREHAFSPQNLRRAIQTLDETPLAQGLQHASEEVYDLLRRGKAFDQSIAGDMRSFTLRYLDWEQPENNVFHVTPEFRLLRAGSQAECRLDLVCFVNGIPFVTIECKAPTVDVDEAIRDTLTYQSDGWVPDLFKFVQVTLALNRRDARYATTGATADYWAVWEAEPGEDVDGAIRDLRALPLPSDEQEALLANFVRERPRYEAVNAHAQEVSAQDRALYNLCRPQRLLELTERFLLYDGGIKKIARYQQYRAVKKALAKLRAFTPDGKRQGGVVWHTQGSGKSLTMVMLANAIALSPDIERPRIVLVTDRTDLDKQLKGTFERCGLEPRRATSGADLRRIIESGKASVITTLVQKFDAALKAEAFTDTSPNIFVLVDESHRTQSGPLRQRMKQVFPYACYIGFTGTPLLHGEKATVKTFGGMIDSYSIDQAVRDKAVVPLLYEARHIEQEVQQTGIDRWFERTCEGLTDKEREDLKRKYSQSKPLLRAEQRLRMIAYDVSQHFRKNWQQDGYYKAQLVAPDKRSAVRLHHYLGEFNLVTSRVVISPVEKEGDDPVGTAPDAGVVQFFEQEVGKYSSPEKYEENTIDLFGSDEAPEILIVVDKLLTGFDVPRNTVLYLARRLTQHSLLQAVARVNRLYAGKDFGYIVDYVGVLGELDRALTEYRALEGFDPDDLEGLLIPVQDEYRHLPQRHGDLLAVFNGVANKHDNEACERWLDDDTRREVFYETLTAFSKTLKIALSTDRFYDETPETDIQRYRAALNRFQKLRASVQLRYADAVDIKKYEPQIAKLLDTYVTSDAVSLLTPEPVNIFDRQAMNRALDRTETTAARADTIAHATARTVTERMDEDPALYRKFSEMLEETIQAFRDKMLSDAEYLTRVTEIQEEVAAQGSRSDTPPGFEANPVAAACYRVLIEHGPAIHLKSDDAPGTALALFEAVRKEAVVDWRAKPDVINAMRANMDDVFFDAASENRLRLEWAALDEVTSEVLRIAKSRLP